MPFDRVRNLLFTALLLCLLVAVPANRGTQAASAAQDAPFDWTLSARFYLPDGTADSSGELQQQVSALGAQTGDDAREAALSGSEGLSQLRAALHAGSGQLFNPITAASEITLSGEVNPGENWSLRLDSNITTGYHWELVSAGENVSAVGDSTYTSTSERTGAPGRQEFSFTAISGGEAQVRLAYRRPFGPPESARLTLHLSAARLAQISDLTNPAADTQELMLPERVDVPGPIELASDGLPASYSWRAQNLLTPVRDQGACGSCWAFGTVGPLEANILIRDNVSVDLSEQYLVSCNSYGWSCERGGSTAHGYHLTPSNYYSLTPPGEPTSGAVLESSFPYTATDSTCNPPHNHPYQMDDWNYITSNMVVSKDVPYLKQAIYQYGPIKASVCAGDAFMNYSSGVFATDESYVCDGGTNHAIVLVGWDDSKGAWILRNSWNTWWGDNGYMLIKYGTSGVGKWASYVQYKNPLIPVPDAPALTSPSNDSILPAAQSTNMSWSTSPNALEYFAQAWTATGQYDSGWTSDTSFPILLPEGYYQWQVKARGLTGDSDWSETRAFTVANLPAVPVLNSPADASYQSTSTNLQLSWNESSGATRYYAALTSPGTNRFSGWINTTSWTVGKLAAGTYQWKVKAQNVAGDSAYSATRSFTVAAPLAAPVLINPTNDLILPIGSVFTLDWNVSAGAVKYQAHVWTDTGYSALSPYLTTPSWDPNSGALAAGIYHWQVKAYGSNGLSSENNPIRTFRVVNPTPPQPIVLYPIHDSLVNNRPDFYIRWKEDPSSVEFSFVLKQGENLTASSGWVTSCEWKAHELPAGVYTLVVTARNPSGVSEPTTIRFTVTDRYVVMLPLLGR